MESGPMATSLILHQYDASPFSQKALMMLGIKGAAYHSVEMPMMPPKDAVMALTGGYRGTPVLQVGSDVYVDSQLIARELDRLLPEPPLVRPLLELLPPCLIKRLKHLSLRHIRSIHSILRILISLHLIIIYVHALDSRRLVIQPEYGSYLEDVECSG